MKPKVNNTEISVDFGSAASTHRRLYGGGRGQPIARAIGLKTYGLPLNVIDATAGLGQDAFVLASLGCELRMIERSPVVAELLTAGLQRGAEQENIKEIIDRMQLFCGDAIEILKDLAATKQPDVIYLDPMFPLRNKSSLVKKEMRILKELVGADQDADLLLTIACQLAKKRVVVKRPRTAPYLNNIAPHASQIGKANRFDIYMPVKN
jgi:16S rRNA (guanine1516-N2)-methyltransferase